MLEIEQLSSKIPGTSNQVWKKTTEIKKLLRRLKRKERHLEKLQREEACLHAEHRKVSA